jgi:nucleotide-binding universal stress UspA family protein
MAGLIVIGYDGSEDAAHAIDSAGRVLDADAALVVNVWMPGLAAADSVLPLGAAPPPLPDQDEQRESVAHGTAQEGVARAVQAGLKAEPMTVRGTSPGDIGHALATLADERGAMAIVVGRRGISRLKEVVLGSTSTATVREARCPVLVVKSEEA